MTRRLPILLLSTASLWAQSEQPALLNVRRIFVDQLTGGAPAAQVRDLVISALQNTKLFIITENPERADTFLRGAADDVIYNDSFDANDSISARAYVGRGSSNTRSGSPADLSLGQNESTHIRERKHEAMATVRLVNKDGDVIWSTTQESTGAKFRSAGADVAERVTRQLIADVEKLRKPAAPPAPAQPSR